MRILELAVLMILILMGCNSQNESEDLSSCTLNSDCPSGKVCLEEICVSIRQECSEENCCFTNANCGEGFACALEINQCFEIECTTSVDCDVDYVCED